MEKKEIKRYCFIAVLAISVCVIIQNFSVVMGLCSIALKALTPMFVGCIMAYIFNIIMNFFEKRFFPKKTSGVLNSLRRPVCLILSFAITIATIVLILNIILPEIVSAFKLVYAVIPPLLVDLRDFALTKLEEYPDIQEQLSSIEINKSAIAEKITDGAFDFFSSLLSLIGTLTATVTNIVIGIIFAIYLLLRKDKLSTDIKRVMKMNFSEKTNRRVSRFFSTAHETFTSFFIGQFIEALIIGTLTFIGASILRLPYAAMTGTIVGVTALIPIVGAFAGAGVSAFIIFTENPKQALIFLIFLIILQQFETNVIYPKVVGSSIGLPGIWVLTAVTLGGGLFGVLGMLLGVPLVATIYKLYFENLEANEIREGIVPPSEKKPEKSKKQEKSIKEKNANHKKA